MVEDARALVDLDEPLDAYGDGVVRRLECQVAGLLGTAEAAFFPSGMMAQQAALRIHAARQGPGVVALHPLSHPQLRESDALPAVAGLSKCPLGETGSATWRERVCQYRQSSVVGELIKK